MTKKIEYYTIILCHLLTISNFLLLISSIKLYSSPYPISLVNDTPGDVNISYIDIISASIQSSVEGLTLTISLRGKIPEDFEGDQLIYRWRFDTLNNYRRGLSYGGIKNDFTFEIIYTPQEGWKGWIIDEIAQAKIINFRRNWIRISDSQVILNIPAGFYCMLYGEIRWIIEALAYQGGANKLDVAPNDGYFTAYILSELRHVPEEMYNMGPRNFEIFVGKKDSKDVYHVGAGKVNSISYSITNTSILYIALGGTFGSGGVYKSLDGGKTWRNVWSDECTYANYVLVHPENSKKAIVTTMFKGIYITNNGGRTWQQTYSQCTVWQLALDPLDPNHVYAASIKGILETKNFGWTWKLVYRSDKPLYSISVARSGGHIYVYAGGGGGCPDIVVLKDNLLLYRIDVNNEIDSTVHTVGSLAASQNTPGLVYVTLCGKTESLYVSTDYGEHWSKVSEPVRLIYFDPVNESILIGETSYSISISHDQGKTWHQLFPYNIKNIDIRYISINPVNNDNIYLCSDQGLWVTYDRGKTWIPLNNISSTLIYNFAINPRYKNIIITSVQDYSPFTSFDGGITWLQLDANKILNNPPVGEGGTVAFNPLRPELAYAYTTAGFQISENYGYSFRHIWNLPPISASSPDAIAFNYSNPKIVYLATSKGIYVSNDWGYTWKLLALQDKRVYSIFIPKNKTNIIFAGCETGFYYSFNAGKTFRKSKTKLTHINSIYYDDSTNKLFIATIDGVFVSIDYGKTFKSISNGLPNWFKGGWGYAVYPFHATFSKILLDTYIEPNLLIVATAGGIYYSKDYGNHWRKLDIKLASSQITDIKIFKNEPDTLYISTFGAGIYVLRNLSKLTQTQLKEEYTQEKYIKLQKMNLNICRNIVNLKGEIATNINVEEIKVFWGNGKSSTGIFPFEHTYELPGNYTIYIVAIGSYLNEKYVYLLKHINISIKRQPIRITVKVNPSQITLRSGSHGRIKFTFNNNYTTYILINSYYWQFTYPDGTIGIEGKGNINLSIPLGEKVWWEDRPYLIPEVVNNAVMKGAKIVYLNYTFIALTILDEQIKLNVTVTIILDTKPTIEIYEVKIEDSTVKINGSAKPGYQNGKIVKITWEWGDGSLEYQNFPASHTYTKEGNYTIKITALQDNGEITSKEIIINISKVSGENRILEMIMLIAISLSIVAIYIIYHKLTRQK